MSFTIEFQQRDKLSFSQLSNDVKMNWLMLPKQNALKQFQKALLPTRKVEHWKYNDMTFLAQQTYSLSSNKCDSSSYTKFNQYSKIELDQSIELIFVDGVLMTSLDTLSRIEGLEITLFENANTAQQQIIVNAANDNIANKNLLISLNEAINQQGLLIQVKENTQIDSPVYLRFFTSSQTENTLSSQKTIVSLGKSSEITLIEVFESELQLNDCLALQQTILDLKENSQLNHYRLNLELDTSRQVSQVKNILDKNTRLNSFFLGLGSRLNRTDLDVVYVGENSESNLTGVYLPAKDQSIDYHTNIEHRVPRCNTREVFRGIIADRASATFNGKIHIFQDAQKSDAYLNNKNLLLTNQAEINTKPELEIYADDVKCAHGATVAQLDYKSLYYLQSRGIDKITAKKMLSMAFVQELISDIKCEPVKDFLTPLLDAYMSEKVA